MRILSSLIVVMLVVFPAAASDTEHTDHDESIGHHDAGGHHSFKHELALFLGTTDEEGHPLEGTLGIEYAYSVSPKVAVGGILEYAGGDLRNLIIMVPVYWKPVGGLMLIAGPGVEYHRGRDGEESHKLTSEGGEVDSDENYFLFRLGTGYAFHFGERYSVVPQVNLDLVNGHQVWVAGATFGVMF